MFPFRDGSRCRSMERGAATVGWCPPGAARRGTPILANDPHLGFSLPCVWYQAHLRAPGFDVAGVTLPGLPLVVIGRNRNIAWGLTNVMQDAADFFVEKLNQ